MPIYDFDNIANGGKQVMDVIKQVTKSTNETVDWIEYCRPGVRGLCTSTYKTKDVEELYSKVVGSSAISVTKLLKNEFGEKSFSFVAPDEIFWNIIEWE